MKISHISWCTGRDICYIVQVFLGPRYTSSWRSCWTVCQLNLLVVLRLWYYSLFVLMALGWGQKPQIKSSKKQEFVHQAIKDAGHCDSSMTWDVCWVLILFLSDSLHNGFCSELCMTTERHEVKLRWYGLHFPHLFTCILGSKCHTVSPGMTR